MYPSIHEACHALEEDGLIAGREVSVTRRSQRRYVLTRQGVTHVTRDFQYEDQLRAALPLTWQMTEAGVTKILLWIPMVESLYEILPTFWTGGLAEPFRSGVRVSGPVLHQSCLAGSAHPDGGPVVATWSSARRGHLPFRAG